MRNPVGGFIRETALARPVPGVPAPPRPARRRVPGLGRAAQVAAASVATLAASAAYAAWKARQAERNHPPIGRFLDVEGARVHYIAAGGGRPVVMLHGVGLMVQDFALSIFPQVSQHWRAIAFDRPGLGYSERPRGRRWSVRAQAAHLRRAMAALDLGPAVIVGHSYGCSVALAMAMDHPEAVAGLVLLGGYYYPVPRIDAALAAPGAVPGLGWLISRTVQPFAMAPLIRPAVQYIFSPAPLPAYFDHGFPWDLALRPSQLRAVNEDYASLPVAVSELYPHYGRIRSPVALIAGDHDRMAGAHHSIRLQRDLPQASLDVVPGGGHMIHHTHPQLVVDAIADVWRRADEAGTR